MSEALFIDVEVDESVAQRSRSSRPSWPRSAPSTSSAGTTTGRCEIVEENLDECVLCELCINAAPAGTVRVIKLYDGCALLGA